MRKKAYLNRTYKKEQTEGVFFFDDGQRTVNLACLELPWKNNEPFVSCIPEGKYLVKETWSPRFKRKLWLVCDVPERSGVRIHPENFSLNLEGCLALVLAFEDLHNDGIFDVTSSRAAHRIAYSVLGKEFDLIIGQWQ